MSFTTTVKEEILSTSTVDGYELAAIIKMSGNLGLTSNGLTLSVSTENAKVARHIYEMLETLCHVKPDIRYHQKTNLKKNRVYHVFIEEQVDKILSQLQLADSFFGFSTGIDHQILVDDEAGRSYLRGAFLSAGTIREPDSGKYQLEIFSIYLDHAQDLANLMKKFLLDAKVIERKNGAVTYLQKADDIMDFLIVINAMAARETFEEIKLMKEARNDINRANNVETANITRTINASMKIINNISKIKDTIGLESLPIELQQIAHIRVTHPEYSLQEIADSLDFPLTKSGVNHRLRKINKIAEEL
ncbi:DNA-binding protein WhiA [Streptococcus zalophi]|uniref:Probable cell division protein WhiA n=1 Tax=Streptococcus zalophi TaxID=640031 RepID=A0A934PAA7_9STRE|nr:DNA-binding protein WhiA [Streptococcus zalophi]MBJ8349715.1 DNA-binding protein WhiA [Streptococcus zalophi]MCR8967936.1 DNA-binding protein WhiA [Streptococcus zalophi]